MGTERFDNFFKVLLKARGRGTSALFLLQHCTVLALDFQQTTEPPEPTRGEQVRGKLVFTHSKVTAHPLRASLNTYYAPSTVLSVKNKQIPQIQSLPSQISA